MNLLPASTILIVEDDHRMRDSLRALIGSRGYDVKTSGNLFDALLMIQDCEYDLIILDLQLEDQSGFALMDYIAVKKLSTQVIIITGQDFERNAITAIKKGAADYLKKPFEPDVFMESVKRIIDRLNDRREKERVSTIIRSSREKFRDVVDNQKDYLFRLDRNYTITFANKAFADVYGKTPKEMIGCAYESFFAKSIRHRLFDKLSKLCSGSGSVEDAYQFRFKTRRNGYQRWRFQGVLDEQGEVVEIQCIGCNTNKKLRTEERQQALNRTKPLSGIIVICSSCKMVRDDKGHWDQLEQYFLEHSDIKFSHSICPVCVTRLYPELYSDETLSTS